MKRKALQKTHILMANLLCARFTKFLHLNPNHKSRFDNPIKHDLLEKDKTTLLFDTIIFPNNCLFTQKVVYQRCEFATQREFQLIFKSQYTCRFFCMKLPEALQRQFRKVQLIHLITQLGYFGIYSQTKFSVYLQCSLLLDL